MSQQGQIPINPMVPQQNQMPPIPMQHHPMQHMHMHMPMQMHMPFHMPHQLPYSTQDAAGYPAPGKRRREDEDPGTTTSGELSAAKRAKGQDVIFRIVVPSRQIGKVIGKEGCRIQKIREETRANIKIADAIAENLTVWLGSVCCFNEIFLYREVTQQHPDICSRHEERVIIISSKDSDEMVTDAEKALEQIANLILKEDDSSLDASKVTAGHVAANTIRLLIAGSQAGGLIGMSGQNIEKLRNSSGAMITVLAPSQLPLCASAHESDRVVQLSGDVSTVMKALEEIGCQLRENPPRQVISISPTYNYAAIRPSQPYVDPNSVDYVTFEMLISETMVGGLIGRCGSNISRIRNESGAMIKVYGGKGEQKHRQIQFGGSAQQVALAKQRVDEYIYSQLIQQSDT
ncbi:KH domain-containing protein at4g18375-like protein [Trifolium pratense]|uniref:KH domain-containing protein at4g18375-like protein n=1 Tax=Trifolium pratense TaxID=57577 RepID=A0A2K3NWY4_TRIPR|nr:KH domain-containing protein at4g18375-like protein [Trifolium pratense]